MKFFIKTFGCRLNLAETDELGQKLPTSSAGRADIIIVRACSVTAGAEQGVRQTIRQFKRAGKTVYVLGCFREKIKEADGYFKTNEGLINFLKNHKNHNSCGRTSYGREKICTLTDKNQARAFIKIQAGCDFECSFCITRLLRGKSKNISQTKLLKQIKEKERQGFQEIILTGTNILLFPDIHNLVKTILKQSTVPRIRFGSVYPRLVTKKFIELFKNPRLQPHLHLSIQSGSEKILRDMKRPIKISKIKSIVKKLRAINPLFNISVDIIVGYPTETEEDFQKTLKLAKELQFSKIHYFPYSPRPNTSAKHLKPLDFKIIKRRLTKIKELDKTLQRKARKKIINKTLAVLFECCENGTCYGYTPNFTRAKYRSQNNLTNKIKEIIITLNYKR